MLRRVLLTALAFLWTVTADAAQTIRVGSKNFSEQFVVAELYAQALEAAGYQVERKLNLGSTHTLHDALRTGSIDVYPEYTGTALTALLREPPSKTDPDSVFDQVQASYRQRFGLEWLSRSRINNGYVIVVRPDIAARYGLRTLSDLAAVAGELNIAVTMEFAERPDGLGGLSASYGIRFRAMRPFTGMRLRYEAMLQSQFEVASAFATDWQIAARNLVPLEDDKSLFPPYELAPVVRAELARDHEAVAIMNRVSAALDTNEMRALNKQVEFEGRRPRDVAADFLRQTGITP